MTIAELIEELKKVDQDKQAYIYVEATDSYDDVIGVEVDSEGEVLIEH